MQEWVVKTYNFDGELLINGALNTPDGDYLLSGLISGVSTFVNKDYESFLIKIKSDGSLLA